MKEYECNMCGFRLIGGYEYYSHVENDEAGWITCPHPAERSVYRRVKGIRRLLSASNSDCVCLDCLHQFQADLGEWSPCGDFIDLYKPRLEQGRDKKECPRCKSERVNTNLETLPRLIS